MARTDKAANGNLRDPRAGIRGHRDTMRYFDGPDTSARMRQVKGLQRKPKWRNAWHNFVRSPAGVYADDLVALVLLIALALLIYSAGFGIEHLVYGG